MGLPGWAGSHGDGPRVHAVLAGVLPDDAVPWVRRSYHVGAVETAAQADWVRWFARRIPLWEARDRLNGYAAIVQMVCDHFLYTHIQEEKRQ